MIKRVLSIALCILMVLTMLPTAIASAAGNNQQQIEAEGGTRSIENGNITISKKVSPTAKENYFDVTLSVTDREIISESATEVVIVLDISNTMTDPHSGSPGSDRFTDARAAAVNFATQYFSSPNLGSVRKLGLVTFNTNAKVTIGLQQIKSSVVNQLRSMTVENLTGLSESQYDASHDRFTNIEGGLRQAKAMLDTGDPKAHKFIILLTDGFPTTYTNKADASGTLLGYDPYDSAGTRFKDKIWNRPCTYGTSYSDTAAKKAQETASAIRKAGINIVSVGIDVNSTAQTIQGYLDKCQNAAYSTIERPAGVHPNGYVIGKANDHKDYRRWLGDAWTAGSTSTTGIGGGPDLKKAYYTGDSLDELNTAFNNIMSTVATVSARSMNKPLVVDPMGEHVEFLGFYNKSGKFVTTNLSGTHAQNGENTASYSSAINWRLDESGYTVSTKTENGKQIAYHTYTLKYRIRLENELADFVEAKDYFTNDEAVLKYTPADENPTDSTTPKEKTEKFPDPKVEGYLASLSFTKTAEDGTTKLSGAEFTLTHDGNSCAVCNGDAPIHTQTVGSDINGVVSFTRIPSGHTYTLRETKSPAGYQPNPTSYKVVVDYDAITVDGKTSFASVPNTAVRPASWTLSGNKTGDAGIAVSGQTFRITDLDRNSEDVTSDAQGAFTFSKTFHGAGTYGFEIREVPGTDEMVVYDDTLYYIQVTVALNSAGTAYEVTNQTIRKSTGGTAEAVTFHNAKRKPAQVELVATKTLEGRLLADNDFSFTLKDASGNTLQTKPNTGNTVTFDKLTFDQPGSYTYQVSEVAGSEPYMVYDATVWNVTVTVTAPANSDTLHAEVSYTRDGATEAANAMTFTNKLVDSGDADFSFTKTDKDGNVLEGAAFTLAHIDCGCGETIATQNAASDANGVVSFTDIPSGHNYRLDEVTEADGDVTIDGKDYQPAYYRDVVVSFGKVYVDGELIQDQDDLVIVNIPLDAARVVLEGIKTVDGVLNTQYDGHFTFTLTEVDANGENAVQLDSQTNMTSASEQNSAASKLIFRPLFYYTEGTHYYIISETAGTLQGMIYDTRDYYVKVVVERDSSGEHLNAKVYAGTEGFDSAAEVVTDAYGSYHGINFNNVLRKPTSAVIQAVKVLDSGTDELEAGAFTFVLRDEAGEVLEEVTNDANGTVAFSPISYDAAGTHNYTISEKLVSGDAVIFDSKVVDVQVTVAEDNADSYSAAITYDGASQTPTFTNAYKGQVIVKKQDEAGHPIVGAEFTLLHSDACQCGGTVEAMTATSRDDGHVLFLNAPSGHTYILRETGVPTGYGPAPDHTVTIVKGKVAVYELGASAPVPEEHHLIINYPAVVISGDKQLVGRDLKAGEFSFVLKDAAGNVVETVTNDSDGYFVFSPLALTHADAGKTLNYTVAEEAGTVPGVIYSGVVYRVTVELDSEMKATVTYDREEQVSATDDNGIASQELTGGILFSNKYTPKAEEVVFGGKKTLNGRAIRAEDFHFELYATDSTYEIPDDELPLQTAYNDADGFYSFEPVVFRGEGTFHYVVKERNNALGGVTYDETVYQVEVTVEDQTDIGELVAKVAVNGEAADPTALNFTNTYTVNGTTEAVISGSKELTGKQIEEDEFTFALVNAEGETVQTTQNKADGTFAFAAETFDTIGTYTYTVKEVAGVEVGMEYDSAVYQVSIHVTDNLAGDLRHEMVVTDMNAEPVEEILFRNTYTKPDGLVLSGEKTIEGRDLIDREFSFTLTQTDSSFQPVADGYTETVTHSLNGFFNFSAITYDTVGTYYYTVHENNENATGVTYDPTVYHVTVTVTHAGEHALAAEAVCVKMGQTAETVDTITFHNVFAPAKITKDIPGTKTLEGMDLTAEAFTFELMDAEGKVIQTVSNDIEGNFVFTNLTFDKAGTYTYTIREAEGDLEHMIYDEKVYTAVVTVTAGADGELEANVVTTDAEGEAAELCFVNTYKEPEPTEPEPTEPEPTEPEPTEPEPTEPEPTEPEPTEPEPTEPEPTEPEPTEPEPTEPEPTEPESTEPEPTEPEPTEPEPTEPEPTEPTNPNVPESGDTSDVFIWITLFLMSLAAMIVLLFSGKKKGGKYLKR